MMRAASDVNTCRPSERYESSCSSEDDSDIELDLVGLGTIPTGKRQRQVLPPHPQSPIHAVIMDEIVMTPPRKRQKIQQTPRPQLPGFEETLTLSRKLKSSLNDNDTVPQPCQIKGGVVASPHPSVRIRVSYNTPNDLENITTYITSGPVRIRKISHANSSPVADSEKRTALYDTAIKSIVAMRGNPRTTITTSRICDHILSKINLIKFMIETVTWSDQLKTVIDFTVS